MKNCNCTLIGTKACENCEDISIFHSPFLKPMENYIYKVFNFYDPDTHELVEKKDAKINKLKKKIQDTFNMIEFTKSDINTYERIIKEKRDIIERYVEVIKKLDLELKELE